METEEKSVKKTTKKSESSEKSLIAKKDWRIISGKWDRKTGKSEYDFTIKAGEVVDVPAKFIEGLKAEGVI